MVLDETLYLIAPRGAWGPEHPAWKPARAALATELIRRSAEQVPDESIHNIVREHAPSTPEARDQAIAFYTSPGGHFWLERREWALRERTYGLPFLVETESREAVVRHSKAAEKALLALPDEQTNAVFEFAQGALGETFRKLGTYPLSFAPDDLHWKDVAAGAPGIAPGETRTLYVDPQGRLGDRP